MDRKTCTLDQDLHNKLKLLADLKATTIMYEIDRAVSDHLVAEMKMIDRIRSIPE